MYPNTRGERIKTLRKKMRLTQRQLSERIDISEKYLSNIETGRDPCSISVLLDLANALDASMDYLLGDDLRYNDTHPSSQGAAHMSLLHQINGMSEADCEHLLHYLDLMREYRQQK